MESRKLDNSSRGRVDVLWFHHLGRVCIPRFSSLSIEECHNILPCEIQSITSRRSRNRRAFSARIHVTKMSPRVVPLVQSVRRAPRFLCQGSGFYEQLRRTKYSMDSVPCRPQSCAAAEGSTTVSSAPHRARPSVHLPFDTALLYAGRIEFQRYVAARSSSQCLAISARSARFTLQSPFISPAAITSQTGLPKYDLLASAVPP